MKHIFSHSWKSWKEGGSVRLCGTITTRYQNDFSLICYAQNICILHKIHMTKRGNYDFENLIETVSIYSMFQYRLKSLIS